MITLVGAWCIFKVQPPTTGGPGFACSHPAHHHWGWAWIFYSFSLPFAISPTLLPPLWPPRPLESKVIQIQSDHPPASSPPVAAMERSKAICSIQVWGRDMGLSSKGSLDFAGLGSPCSWAPPLFLLLDVALLHSWPPHLCDWQFHLVVEESLVPSLAPPLLSSFEERLGCFLKALLSLLPHFSFLHVLLLSPKLPLGGYCMHWGWLSRFSRCLLTGCHWLCLWFPTFWTTFLRWSGWASLLAGGEHLRGLWVLARCMFVFCLTRSHQVLGWSSCLALSNQQACVRPGCFTGRLRPLGTGFFNGAMVLSFWSAPSTIKIPALRVPRYRLAPVDCYLSSPVTGKAPC